MTAFPAEPVTEAGQRFVDAARAVSPLLRERAAAADDASAMDPANVRLLVESGVASAFVPESLGGLGLDCIHDWALGMSSLGQGDGSTAIAINMHLGVSRGLAAGWHASGGTSAPLGEQLRAIVRGDMLICATATERGTDNLHPLTEASLADGGYRIDGTKLFVTLSPVATHLGMNLRLRNDEGDHLVTTLLPIGMPGIQPQGDWQALGMRASGSQSIVFDNVRIPKQALRHLGPWGRWSTTSLTNRALGNLTLVGVFLGIAEHAAELALTSLRQQKRNGRPAAELPGVRHMTGEMAIELATCRDVLLATARRADAFLRVPQPTLAQSHELMRDYQTAKWVVNRGAINIVNTAMDLVGGSSYMQSSTLSRLYRDVRAGPFMQPGARPEAREYIGRVALGDYPED
ncbi:MAG: acyl-CoA/acyl-ACP dehydrogenase [Pseudomonadales bacterium]|nr:acyl-CoA/acyl-ACP dehydrogenase [Pseudomonadales bacterium]MCP5183367.1 acyl-CoA/acyl-ACP dehydrogenase [Pseudomonadales bacterium]